jgi:alkylation response protein AidB-like acyl-CoA dehydrogenase
MDFTEPEERKLLRDAVRKAAAGFGHDYYARKARAGEKTTELWQALADGGFSGSTSPRPSGGGMGIGSRGGRRGAVPSSRCSSS